MSPDAVAARRTSSSVRPLRLHVWRRSAGSQRQRSHQSSRRSTTWRVLTSLTSYSVRGGRVCSLKRVPLPKQSKQSKELYHTTFFLTIPLPKRIKNVVNTTKLPVKSPHWLRAVPTSRYSNRRYLTGCRPTTPPAQTLDCTRQGTCRGGFCPPACPRRGLLALTQPHERVGTFHQTGVRGRRLSKLPTPGVAPAGPRCSWVSRGVM